MKRKLSIFALVVVALVLVGCQPPPPLRSDKYLNDTSYLTAADCELPCYQGIIVGSTTYVDALSKVRSNTQFSNVQTQDRNGENPAQAAWSTSGGEVCCQLYENIGTGLVEGMAFRLAPTTTTAQLVEKFGEPAYVQPISYSQEEVVIQLIYPDQGTVFWVAPGSENNSLEANTPVVAMLLVDPKVFPDLLKSAVLQGWQGYQPYKTYRDATPILTPEVTATGGQ